MNRNKMYDTYVTPSGKTKYRSRIRVNGKRVSKSFNTLSDLRFWLAKMEKVRRQAHLGESAYVPTSFKEASQRWFVEYVDVHMAPSMHVCIREIYCTQFFPPFGARDLKDISAQDWEALLSRLTTERAWRPATFNRRRSLLMALYKWGIEQGLCSDNPIKRIKKRREWGTEARFLTSPELQLFLEASETNRYSVCFYILANTGMRVSEALGLRWCDVDLSAGWIRISRIFCKATGQIEERTKSGRTRMLGLNQALCEILLEERRRSIGTGAQDLIVANEEGLSPGHSGIRRNFDLSRKQAGLRHYSVHDLRHTFASIFMMNGGNLWDLKNILGHSTIDLTDRYSHFSPNHLKQQAEQVSFGGSRKAAVVRMAR